MMNILLKLKENNKEIPVWLGQILAGIPFRFRPGIGALYQARKKTLYQFENSDLTFQQSYILESFVKIYKHAFLNVPFYNNLYRKAGLNVNSIQTFDDIEKVPIITKKDLFSVALEERSYRIKNRAIVNTGGSSGKTLSFYMDPRRFGNEWAHIHYIWQHLDYKPSDLKIQFDGRSKVKNGIQYDFVRHSLRYDIYSNPVETNQNLFEIVKKYKVKFLHGYPSAIYNFALSCREHNPELLKILRDQLKGAFLVSEFPNPKFRSVISEIFDIPTQSFYGHTETCVMAFEKENLYEFEVLQSYGYAEAVKTNCNGYNLIGTNYFNFASPLIRYDTEDGIDHLQKNKNILKKFKIIEGRRGEFILDRHLKKISLTGLIYGRHHKLFDISSHIQVSQNKKGKATVFFVPENPKKANYDFKNLFDDSNIDIEFTFKKISTPILTSSGKINLLVNHH